jgi:hypothetical protein
MIDPADAADGVVTHNRGRKSYAARFFVRPFLSIGEPADCAGGLRVYRTKSDVFASAFPAQIASFSKSWAVSRPNPAQPAPFRCRHAARCKQMLYLPVDRAVPLPYTRDLNDDPFPQRYPGRVNRLRTARAAARFWRPGSRPADAEASATTSAAPSQIKQTRPPSHPARAQTALILTQRAA